MTGLLQLALEGVENFRARAKAFGKRLGADRHHHDFLEIDWIVRMHTTVDDVHHRHRKDPCRGSADVAIERHAERFSRGLGNGERHTENGVGAKPAFVRGAVEIDHGLVDLNLLLGLHAADGVENLTVDRLDSLLHALAEIPALVAIAQFDSFMCARGSARGNGGAAQRTVFQHHIDLNGRIAAAVQNFAADDVDDGGHVHPLRAWD